jgi:hypothetical protein
LIFGLHPVGGWPKELRLKKADDTNTTFVGGDAARGGQNHDRRPPLKLDNPYSLWMVDLRSKAAFQVL